MNAASLHPSSRVQISQGIFRFAFRVYGSGAGMVVGVADVASTKEEQGDEENGDSIHGWGLHLAHGALYTKRPGSDKGQLSTKQLVPSMAPLYPEDDPESTGFVQKAFDVEIQVDMDRRRLAFGVPDGPLVEAPVKISGCVRPWAYLWSGTDSVMLDARPPPSRGNARARIVRSLAFRTGDNEPKGIWGGPMPLRARMVDPLPFAPTHPIPAVKLERSSYLPPFAVMDRTAAEARANARQNTRQAASLAAARATSQSLSLPPHEGSGVSEHVRTVSPRSPRLLRSPRSPRARGVQHM